jgi:hypothetical protein
MPQAEDAYRDRKGLVSMHEMQASSGFKEVTRCVIEKNIHSVPCVGLNMIAWNLPIDVVSIYSIMKKR